MEDRKKTKAKPALESFKLGRGDTTYVSKVILVDRKNILQEINELKEKFLVFTPSVRQRKKNGGRKNRNNSGDKRVDDRNN